MTEPLLRPFFYLHKTKGKGVRDSLVREMLRINPIPEEQIKELLNMVRTIHTSSLLVDDIEDESLLRRGKPTAHLHFGVARTLNAAYLAIFDSLVGLENQGEKLILKNSLRVLKDLGLGQGQDLEFKENYLKDGTVPLWDQYLEMVSLKTGSLVDTIFETTYQLSHSPCNHETRERWKDHLSKFSIFYQIRDDYINLVSPDYWATKGVCEDFDERKISCLIVLFSKTVLEEGRVHIANLFRNLFLKKRKTLEDKFLMLNCMIETNVLMKIHTLLEDYKTGLISFEKENYGEKKIAESLIIPPPLTHTALETMQRTLKRGKVC